jgi:hypothetical protein
MCHSVGGQYLASHTLVKEPGRGKPELHVVVVQGHRAVLRASPGLNMRDRSSRRERLHIAADSQSHLGTTEVTFSEVFFRCRN